MIYLSFFSFFPCKNIFTVHFLMFNPLCKDHGNAASKETCLVWLSVSFDCKYLCQKLPYIVSSSRVPLPPSQSTSINASNLLSSFPVFKVMTILSALVGWAAPNLVRKSIAQIEYVILARLFSLPARAWTSDNFKCPFCLHAL